MHQARILQLQHGIVGALLGSGRETTMQARTIIALALLIHRCIIIILSTFITTAICNFGTHFARTLALIGLIALALLIQLRNMVCGCLDLFKV